MMRIIQMKKPKEKKKKMRKGRTSSFYCSNRNNPMALMTLKAIKRKKKNSSTLNQIIWGLLTPMIAILIVALSITNSKIKIRKLTLNQYQILNIIMN